jgi:hypothetical protein
MTGHGANSTACLGARQITGAPEPPPTLKGDKGGKGGKKGKTGKKGKGGKKGKWG